MPASPIVRARAAGSTASPACGDADGEPFRFDKLREDAWERFLTKSADLAAAHPQRNTRQSREGGWVIAQWIRFFQWLWHVVKSPAEGAPLPGPIHELGLRESRPTHGSGLRGSGPTRATGLHKSGEAGPSLRENSPTHGTGMPGSSPTDGPGLRGSGEAALPRSVREFSDRPSPTDRADRPGRLGRPGLLGRLGRAERPDLPGRPGLPSRAERERRTALAVRSARIAGAIRGAQRARVQSCREPVGAQTIGGTAWA